MEPKVSGVGVLDKSFGVVALVAESPRTLAELIQGTGLSRATAHRLALALEAHGFRVLRFDNREVLTQVEGVLARVLEWLHANCPLTPALSRLRERGFKTEGLRA